MGNEISSEAVNQGVLPSFDLHNEQDAFFAPSPVNEQHPNEAPEEIRPMDEDEINREVKKMSCATIDVHNTGVSEQLKQLLATLHEGESSPEVSTSGSSGGAKAGFSASAQEFVPGKPFALPSTASAQSDLEEVKPVVSGGLSLKADAPEFVPSWQTKTAAVPGNVVGGGGVLPMPSGNGSLSNVRVIDKKVWWYRDPAGVVRGPFSTTEMRAWADKGYFSGGLEIALSDRGPYLPLSSVYPSPERAFWKSIEPREFATRMRQHILATRNVMTEL